MMKKTILASAILLILCGNTEAQTYPSPTLYSTNITTQQTGSNTQQRTIPNKFQDISFVEDFSTGGSDDTVQIQNAITWLSSATNRKLSFSNKTYTISSQLNLNGLSQFYIEGNGAIIKMANGVAVSSGFSILYLTNCTNGTIIDLKTDGNRANRTPAEVPAHVWQIYTGCASLNFERCRADNSPVDGFYVATATPNTLSTLPTDIRFYECAATNAYRNNMSVINSNRFREFNGIYTSANGTAPQAGIDFEPNSNSDQGNIDIRCYNTRCSGNTGPGFQIALSNTAVIFYNCSANTNSQNGFLAGNNPTITMWNCEALGNTVNAIGGKWAYLEINGFDTSGYTSGITGGIVYITAVTGTTIINNLVDNGSSTGSDTKPLISVTNTTTGLVLIDGVTGNGTGMALLNAQSKVFARNIKSIGANTNYIIYVQNSAAAESIIKDVYGNGTVNGIYVNTANVEVDGVTLINPTVTSSQLVWFDSSATNPVFKNYRLFQDTAIPSGQKGAYFANVPRYVDNLSGFCAGTNYTNSNFCVFNAGISGGYIGTVSPYTGTGTASSVGALAIANNLSDVNSASTSRTNLGLGTSATTNIGTSGGTVPFLNGSNTWSSNQTFSGAIFVSNSSTFGGNITTTGGNYQANIASPGGYRSYELTTATSPRWDFAASGTESGTNTGSNLSISRYDDSGSFLSTPVSINRATGNITLGSTTASSLALTSALTPANGGTGLATLTAHNVLLGEGTSSVAFAAPGTSGQMLLSAGASSDPAFGNNPVITGGTINGAVIGGTTPANGTFSNITSNGNLDVTAASGYRSLLIQTAGTSRWDFAVNGTESGTNTGSNLSISAYSDAGSFLSSPITINRATQVITLGTVASVTITSATINGGAINSTTVGATTPSTGAFTTLSFSSSLSPSASGTLDFGTNALRLRNLYQNGKYVNNATIVTVPTTGNTVTVAATTNCQICQPAGALLALTIQFPTAVSDGDIFRLVITQSITTLTLTPAGGDTIVSNSLTSVTNYLSTSFLYKSSSTTWFQV